MRYLDTSLVVSLITSERHTEQAQVWLRDQPAGDIFVSDWVTTEIASALSLKQRTGVLRATDRVRAEDTYAELCASVFEVLDVRSTVFTAAARYAGRSEVALRAGDALHLAVAVEHHARLCTRDVRQAEAGQRLGLDVFLLAAQLPG